jgi:hypothetical protein
MRDLATVWQQIDSAIQQFLVVEVDIGMTFAEAAMSASSTSERLHNRQLARRAYDTGLRWMIRARFTRQDTKTYHRRLRQLRLVLNQLGDPIQDSYCVDVASPRAS